MITLTIRRKENAKKLTYFKTETKIFKNASEAKSLIAEVVIEKKRALERHEEPSLEIVGVSYDTKSERQFLVETGAIETND